MKKKKLISYILSIILIINLLFIGYLKITDTTMFSMVSPSMEPEIKVGSLILNRKKPFKEIEKGDIITYQMNNASLFITHRVIEIDQENERVLCKGDANLDVDDSFVFASQYKGMLINSIPYLGYIVVLMNTWYGKLICFAMIIYLIGSVIYELYKYRKNR